jgi:hypothetical protein
MRIERHKTISYDYTFSFTDSETREILRHANAERTKDQKPLTEILYITFVCKGEDDYTRENVKLNVTDRKKQHIISR